MERFNTRIFKYREALYDSYIPEKPLHRDNEVKRIMEILKCSIINNIPRNILVYGKPGVGKTLVINYVTRIIKNDEGLNRNLICCYINCKNLQTRYRILAEILKSFNIHVPVSGWSSDKLYLLLRDKLKDTNCYLIVVLDEIDEIIKKRNDSILYTLVRLNTEIGSSRVSIIGISNRVDFLKNIDDRILSTIDGVKIIFHPYNLEELRDIIYERVKLALNDNVIDFNVLDYVAAYVMRESRDVRKALNIIRLAGELAEKEGSNKITLDHIKRAIKHLDVKIYEEIVKDLPLHYKLILYILVVLSNEGRRLTTGFIYSIYERLCSSLNIEKLSKKRISEIITELENMGFISCKIVNRGRYGRTREIHLNFENLEAIKNCINILSGDFDEKERYNKKTS